jgi:hypothetical protein
MYGSLHTMDDTRAGGGKTRVSSEINDRDKCIHPTQNRLRGCKGRMLITRMGHASRRLNEYIRGEY